MNGKSERFSPPCLERRITIFVGGFGSGKSEVAVNFSRFLAENGLQPVAIADLDIVNPYFRSREAADRLRELGIETIIPPGDQAAADLPIIVPEIKGAIEGFRGRLVLDVGGDDIGARVLSSVTDAIPASEYDMLLVLNANRPFTSKLEGCLQLVREIESASRLKFTAIVSNTHFLEGTTAETVTAGLELAQQVSAELKIPVAFVSAVEGVLWQIEPQLLKVPALPLRRWLLKPWERPVG